MESIQGVIRLPTGHPVCKTGDSPSNRSVKIERHSTVRNGLISIVSVSTTSLGSSYHIHMGIWAEHGDPHRLERLTDLRVYPFAGRETANEENGLQIIYFFNIPEQDEAVKDLTLIGKYAVDICVLIASTMHVTEGSKNPARVVL